MDDQTARRGFLIQQCMSSSALRKMALVVRRFGKYLKAVVSEGTCVYSTLSFVCDTSSSAQAEQTFARMLARSSRSLVRKSSIPKVSAFHYGCNGTSGKAHLFGREPDYRLMSIRLSVSHAGLLWAVGDLNSACFTSVLCRAALFLLGTRISSYSVFLL